MKNIPKRFKHQKNAFDFIQYLNAFALLMDQGVGKTRIIIDKANFLYKTEKIDTVIVICLNFLKDQWLEEFKIHSQVDFVGYIWKGKITSKNGKDIFNLFCSREELKIFCVNVEAFATKTIDSYLQRLLEYSIDAFIVIDESITIKNPKAKRTDKIIKGFRNRKYKAILSGTPTPNSPADLYCQFEFLKPGFFKCSYFQFRNRHILLIKEKERTTQKTYLRPITEKDFSKIKNAIKRYGKLTPDIMFSLSSLYNISERNIQLINRMEKGNFSPYKDMVTLNQKISPITFRITKKECFDLPDKVYEKLLIDLSTEQKKLIKELKKDYFTFYDNKQLTVSNSLSLLTRYRMITGGLFPYQDFMNVSYEDLFKKLQTKVSRIKPNPKLQALKQDLETVSRETSIIVWACYVEELKYIYDELKDIYTCALFYGEVPTNERTEIIEQFKAKNTQILIANPKVAGMGLNLQVSTLHYFYSNDYRSDFRLQAEDRSHRAGQINKVLYKDLICKDSIDQKIYDCLQNKIDIVEYFKNKDNLKNIFY